MCVSVLLHAIRENLCRDTASGVVFFLENMVKRVLGTIRNDLMIKKRFSEAWKDVSAVIMAWILGTNDIDIEFLAWILKLAERFLGIFYENIFQEKLLEITNGFFSILKENTYFQKISIKYWREKFFFTNKLLKKNSNDFKSLNLKKKFYWNFNVISNYFEG